MQTPIRPTSTSSLGRRFSGILRDTMDLIPDTLAWYGTEAAFKPIDVYQRKPQQAFNTATTFVQQREAFGGQPGGLYGARSRLLANDDPSVRAIGMDFLDQLQGLPLLQQQSVLAFLRGETAPAVVPAGEGAQLNADQQATIVESLLGDQVDVNTQEGTLNIEGTGSEREIGLSGQSLYSALKIAFPELDLNISQSDIADELLNDISSGARGLVEGGYGSEAAVTAGAALRDYATGDIPLKTALARGVPAGVQVFGDVGWGAAGFLGREAGAEGIVDDVAAYWDNVEQGLSDTLTGYYDPALGANVPGLLNWGLEERVANEHPDWDQDQINSEVEEQTRKRAEVFTVVAAVSGLVGGGLGGAVGRRVKEASSIISTTEEGVKAALPLKIKAAGGTGLIDRAAEVYRTPARKVLNWVDDGIVKLFRTDPDAFFQEAMFGRLYQGGGAKLIKALKEAKKKFPGDVDRQVGWLTERSGTQVPDTLFRRMLAAGSVEDAKVAFVDYATSPQGPDVIRTLRGQLAGRTQRIAQTTERLAEGEDGIAWNAKIERYNELANPAAQRARESIFGPEEGGMDASPWKDATPERKAELVRVVPEEAELAQLRRDLGFVPSTTDRFGKDFVPSETPVPILPGDGDVINMPRSEVERLADPELWDPATSQGTSGRTPEGAWQDSPYREYSGKRPEGDVNDKGVEVVPLEVLEEMPGNPVDPEKVDTLAREIDAEGLNEELIIEFDPETNRAYLGEGNHRAAALRQLGYDNAPVRVVKGIVPEGRGVSVTPKVRADQFGWVPSDLAPSWAGIETADKIGKLSKDKYARLKAEIEANGITEPIDISVNPRTGEALPSEGFHRWRAATELGLDEIPVRITHDTNVSGVQFFEPQPRPRPSAVDLQSIARQRLAIQALEERLATTADDAPMIHYPKQSFIRAVVRAPSTRAERYLANVLRVGQMGPGQFADLAKFVDELPSRPILYVPGHADNPADWSARNTATLSNYLRRAGVGVDDTAEALGHLGRVRNAQEFYEVLEREIFGEGGIIDTNLHPKVDEELRGKLIYLHGRAPESRTRSRLRSSVEVGGGRTAVDTPVLGVQKGGELIPLPSRPIEFLKEVPLPAVDDLIEATSLIRRVVRNAEKRRIGAVNAAAPYKAARLLFRIQTATLKPLVMLVRLPAMGMRIQLEQTLRMSASGYKPFKGFPDGATLFPGGIPIPFTRRLAGLGGAEMPTNIRVLQGMFGEDGWKLIDPDPYARGAASQLPNNMELGGFLEENIDDGPSEAYAVSTEELRTNPGKINSHHTESYRSELEMAHSDFVDRKLAQLGLDRAKMKEWLLRSNRGRKFMDEQMNVQLERSTLYPSAGNPDGMRIELDATEAAQYVEFPNRLRTDNPVGRTPEQIAQLRRDLEGGYDPNFVGDSGVPEGHLTIEYNPRTGNAIIREGHHRIGIEAEKGNKMTFEVKVVDDTPAVRGLDVDEVDVSEALAELSRLSPKGDSVGKAFDMERFTGTPEARLDGAVDAWLDARIDYLNQITANGVDMLDYISTGKLRSVDSGTVRTFDPSGNSIAYRHATLQTDVGNIRAELLERRARGDQFNPELKDDYTALQITLRERERRLAEHLEEYADDLGVSHISAGDKRAFRNEIKRRWTEDPTQIPERLMLETKGFRSGKDVGLIDDLHRWAEASSSAMYRPFRAISYLDRHGTRGSLWTQEYARSLRKWESRGYTPSQAKPLAYADAGNVTRDLMYDLNARTSVQRALKDLFWFAPATQEVLYTWLVKIPAQSYWPIGAASLVLRGKIGLRLLEEMGVTEQNAKGETIIKVPFLGKMVETFSGGTVKVADMQYGKLEGLNLVTTGGGVPGLSTLGNFVLGRAALKWGGFAKEMSDVFQPYGPEASLLPQPITFLHEAVFGDAPPFEPLSGAYTKAQWDRAFDQSIQYAYHDLAEDGIKPPRVEDFGHVEEDRIVLSVEEEEQYQAAASAYLDELMGLGKDYAQGYAWTRLMGSTVMPMSIYVTSEEREAWDTFWGDLIGEDGTTGQFSEQQRNKVSEYLSDHPNSLAFSVFTTKYGEKQRDLPFAESLDDAFFDAYYRGEASTLTPDEYSHKLMASESRRHYQATLDTELRKISPDLDPWELLRNAGARSAALTRYNESWQRFLDLNPESEILINEQSRSWAESEQIPKRSFEAERLATTLALLKQITPMLTGEDDIRPDELRAVQGQISQLFGDTGEFPEASTPTAKAMEWWYNEVLNPYLDKTATLYEQAEDMQSRGLDASGVYDQLRELANTPPPSYKGEQTVPSVEEFFWGNKTPGEREATKVTWASRPITWLSDFQRETVGYNVSEQGAEFLDTVAEFDNWFYDQLEERDISSSSTEWDKWQKFREERLGGLAEEGGDETQRLWALSEAAPITRITASGFGADSDTFRQIVEAAEYTRTSIQEAGYSPKSYSETALEWKAWFYNATQNIVANDPAMQDLLNKLELSFPLDGGGYRQGVVLYEAVFFGNFNEKFIPPALAALGG